MSRKRTAWNSTLPQGQPLKRNKGLQLGRSSAKKKATKRKPGKQKQHSKSLPRMEAATEKRCMAFFRGQPCVFCLWLSGIENRNTVGHHIVPKSRCRPGRHDPANLVPVCSAHHTMGNEYAAHSSNPIAAHRFMDALRLFMPKRYAACMALDERAKRGAKYSSEEKREDHAFWEAVEQNGRSYEFVCETADVEDTLQEQPNGED